jgi:hypothetical protein
MKISFGDKYITALKPSISKAYTINMRVYDAKKFIKLICMHFFLIILLHHD